MRSCAKTSCEPHALRIHRRLGQAVYIAMALAVGWRPAVADERTGPEVTIGGYVKVDFIQDFAPVGNPYQWKTNSIPVSPGADEQGGQTTIHARETRVTLTLLQDTNRGKLKAYIEGDFFGDNNAFRVRHAYGEFGSFLGGQTWTTFQDISSRPRSLDYEGPDAEIFVRQAMIRWIHKLSESTTWAVAVEQPGGQFAIPDTLSGQARSTVPDVPAYLRHAGARGHLQLAGLVRQIRFDGDAGSPDQSVVGWGANLSFRLNTGGKNGLMGEAAFGQGIGRYIESLNSEQADAFFDINLQLEALEASAGVLAYEHHWSGSLQSSVAVSGALLEANNSLPAGAVRRTRDARANLIWAVDSMVDVGGEVLWGQRRNQNGAEGDAWRLQFSMIYKLN